MDLGDGLASESNGVPVCLPTHSDLALWPDQLLTILYKALAICYQDHIVKLGEAARTQSSIPGSSLVNASLLHRLGESRSHYNSITTRVDGTDLIESLDGRGTARVVVRLPKTRIEADQGSRLPSIFYVARRTEQPQPLHHAQSAALSQVESLKITCNLQRGTLEQLHRDVQRLTLQVDWKEEEIKRTELARRQLAQEHDHLKEEITMLKADNTNLELARQRELQSGHEERELRKTDLARLAKIYESLQMSQNGNTILNSNVDRLEAQLKETETAWSKAAQECDFLEVEVERLNAEMGTSLYLGRSETREEAEQRFLQEILVASCSSPKNTGSEEWPNVLASWDNSQTDIRDG